jgi:hypothetical protein
MSDKVVKKVPEKKEKLESPYKGIFFFDWSE